MPLPSIFMLSLPYGHSTYLCSDNLSDDKISEIQKIADSMTCSEQLAHTAEGRLDMANIFLTIVKSQLDVQLTIVPVKEVFRIRPAFTENTYDEEG